MKAAQLKRLRRVAFDQRPPGEACGLAGEHALHRVRGAGEHRRRRVQFDLVLVDADQHVLDHRDQAAQARILPEVGDERGAARQPVEARLQLIQRHEQQAIAREEIRGAGVAHRFEVRRVQLERRGQRIGRRRSEFGGRRIEHDVDDLEALERILEDDAALTPRQVLGEERVDVGGDRKMCGGVNAADDGEQNAKGNDATRKTQTNIDDPADEFRQHGRALAPEQKTAGGETKKARLTPLRGQ
jgi:hypothetical protein